MRSRSLFIYVVMVLILGGALLAILQYGQLVYGLEPHQVIASGKKDPGTHEALFILQLLTILSATRAAGLLAKAIGQPEVVGDMVAGIILGPTLIGRVAPGLSEALFPAASLPRLETIGKLGVLLFLFLVGLELDLGTLRKRVHSAVMVSHASILFPFLLGVGVTFMVFKDHAQTGFIATALFLGISMSVTAFPVLARILFERRMEDTPLGIMAIAAAAIDDVTAWCLLALVVAIAKAGSLSGFAIAGVASTAGVAAFWMLGRPALAALLGHGKSPETASHKTLVYALAALLAGAFLTEVAGIHALFGAFLAGAAMPRHPKLRLFLRTRLEPLSTSLLLPMFFAMTGLRTEIGFLFTSEGLLLTALIIAVAILGKFGGTLVAARFTGMSWLDSARLGVLMNTRGLMELIVLNIGYEMGILSRPLFTAMVVMALVTTALTTPGLRLLRTPPRPEAPEEGAPSRRAAIDTIQSH